MRRRPARDGSAGPSRRITGLGVVSPLGHSVDRADAALRRRRARAERRRRRRARSPRSRSTPMPADTRARIGRLDRLCRLFLAASYLAVDDAGLASRRATPSASASRSAPASAACSPTPSSTTRSSRRVPAAASPRVFAYTVSSAAAGEVSIALGIHGPNVTSHRASPPVWARSATAVDLIRTGKADVVLAGGADALGTRAAEALRDMRLLKVAGAARPFRDARARRLAVGGRGGGGARARRARARHAARACRGRIDGYAAGFEPTLTAPRRDATALSATMRRALAASGRRADEIGAVVIASAHGTPLDDGERAALRTVLGDHRRARAQGGGGRDASPPRACSASALAAGCSPARRWHSVALRLDGTMLPERGARAMPAAGAGQRAVLLGHASRRWCWRALRSTPPGGTGAQEQPRSARHRVRRGAAQLRLGHLAHTWHGRVPGGRLRADGGPSGPVLVPERRRRCRSPCASC